MPRRQSLARLRNTVQRFTGVVDRFGSFPSRGDTTHTLCVRDLRLADCDTPLDPDHWWFHAREVWIRAGLRVGDTVLFTAKVQRASKGRHDPPLHHLGNPRRQVVGFASTPRSVVVVGRRHGNQHLLDSLESTLAQRESHLCVTLQEQERLAGHYSHLLLRYEELEGELQRRRQQERQLRQEEISREGLQRQLAEGQRQQQRLRRRLAVVAALGFGAGGLAGAALLAGLQRGAPDGHSPVPALRR